MRATDADAGRNGQVTYRLSDDTGTFTIGESGVIHATRSLTQPSYSFNVIATDLGSPPRYGSSRVVIEVKTTEKSNLPKFKQQFYKFKVLERNFNTFSVYAEYSVPNTTLLYRIRSYGDVPFAINNATGIIRTLSLLDRERKDVYDFDVVASVIGKPSQMTAVPVTIQVMDLNDNAPQFLRSPIRVSIFCISFKRSMII